jgi:hypothetical protein
MRRLTSFIDGSDEIGSVQPVVRPRTRRPRVRREVTSQPRVELFADSGVVMMEGANPKNPMMVIQEIDDGHPDMTDQNIYFGDPEDEDFCGMKKPIVGPALSAVILDSENSDKGVNIKLAVRADVGNDVVGLRNRRHPDFAFTFVAPGRFQRVGFMGQRIRVTAVSGDTLSIRSDDFNQATLVVHANTLRDLLADEETPSELSAWQQQGLGFTGSDEGSVLKALVDKLEDEGVDKTKWALIHG